MSITPTTRTGKGSELSWAELDSNFTTIASAINFLLPADASFSTAIPFTGNLFMPQQAVSSVLAFTVAGSPVKGAKVYVRLVADGTNAPTFSAFKEWGGSSGYDNRTGITNEIEFWFDGYDYWYSISQQIGATAVATSVTMIGPSSGTVSVASTNFTIGANGTITGTVIVTPSDGGAGGTFTPTTVSISSGTPTATFTYTPASTGAKTISVTNNGGLTNPSNITYTASSGATVPGAPTIGTATAGDTTATVTFTPPGSDGGSTITGYTVTSTPGSITASGASSPINVTGLTNGTAYTFTVHATNSIGNSSESAASNSVTPAVSATNLRLSSLSSLTESGTGPWTYTGTGGNWGVAIGGVATTHLQSGVDGYVQVTIGTYDSTHQYFIALDQGSTVQVFGSLNYFLFTDSTQYRPMTNGSSQTATNVVVPAAGDVMRMRRTGSSIVAEVSKNSGSTWTTIYTWTGADTGVLYAEMSITSGTMTNLLGYGLA